MPKKIYILNGPNLNLLGVREPHIYGSETLEDIKKRCVERAQAYGLEIEFRQSNFEGAIIESIHEARMDGAAIIINPAAYTFTSIAILDALKTFDKPIIELHISNVHKREEYYHNSYVSKVATAVMAGFGADGYVLAIDGLAMKLK
jgi:3-dehydroquinate dehydratase II